MTLVRFRHGATGVSGSGRTILAEDCSAAAGGVAVGTAVCANARLGKKSSDTNADVIWREEVAIVKMGKAKNTS
jgi:hypothetical protein